MSQRDEDVTHVHPLRSVDGGSPTDKTQANMNEQAGAASGRSPGVSNQSLGRLVQLLEDADREVTREVGGPKARMRSPAPYRAMLILSN